MTDRFIFGVVCQSVTVTLKSLPLGQHARKVTFKSGNTSMDHHFSMRPRCTPSPFSPHLTNTLAGIRVNFPLALHPLKFSFSNNIAGYLSVGCGSPINDKIFLKKIYGKDKTQKLICVQLILFDVEPCFNPLSFKLDIF